MSIKKMGVEFVTVFAVALVSAAMVTLLWNFIGHGESTIDRETSFLFAVLFGIIQTWVKWREVKENKVFIIENCSVSAHSRRTGIGNPSERRKGSIWQARSAGFSLSIKSPSNTSR